MSIDNSTKRIIWEPNYLPPFLINISLLFSTHQHGYRKPNWHMFFHVHDIYVYIIYQYFFFCKINNNNDELLKIIREHKKGKKKVVIVWRNVELKLSYTQCFGWSTTIDKHEIEVGLVNMQRIHLQYTL